MRSSNLERSLEAIAFVGLVGMIIQFICWIIKISFIIIYRTSRFIYVKVLKPLYIKLLKQRINKLKIYVTGRFNGISRKTKSKSRNDE